jgi:carboxyl-terminal processing protease
VYKAKAGRDAQKYPIVVLVDRGSASASEIVSGALQDHDRAWILGETTFGKGLVQGQFPLSEGGALVLTIAHYFTPSGRLIQRDYSHQSFWQYYSHQDNPVNTDDVKATDSGRKVYGGGGITPDEKYDSPKLTVLQRRLWPSNYLHFYRFANIYFGAAKPHLAAGWQPDANTMQRFQEYLRKEQIPFTEAEFAANKDWIAEQIRWELYFRAFDKKAANRARWQDDPEARKAMDSMPKAQSLLKDAQRVYALRASR